MARVLTSAQIEKLDCPTICEYFTAEEILNGVRNYLEQTTELGHADGPMLFAVAYAKYHGSDMRTSTAFERALREFREWKAKGVLPAYVGSYFREWLKQQATRAA